MLADGTTLLDSSGNLELDSTGLERQTDGLADDCCCPEMTPPCDVCPPNFLASLALSLPCVNCGDGTSYGPVDSTFFDVTICLRFISTSGTVCTWQGSAATDCSMILHCDAADCGGTCVDGGGGITSTLTIDGTALDLTVWVAGYEVFHGTATVTDCTQNPITIAADGTTPGCAGLVPNFNNGGSVTLVPGDCPAAVVSTCADPAVCIDCHGSSPTQYTIAVSQLVLDTDCTDNGSSTGHHFFGCGGAVTVDAAQPTTIDGVVIGFCLGWSTAAPVTGPQWTHYQNDGVPPNDYVCNTISLVQNTYSMSLDAISCGEWIKFTLTIINADNIAVFLGSIWAQSCNEILTFVNQLHSRSCEFADGLTSTQSPVYGGIATATPC